MKTTYPLQVTATPARCGLGETIGRRNINEGAVPVLSCEGGCIRGEIARLAANRVAQAPGFRRGCHGELFAVPHSAMAGWVRDAREVVVIDGCPLRCHARIIEHLVAAQRLRSFDALSHHRRFSDVFDIEAVPEADRRAAADSVATWVLGELASKRASTVPAASCPPNASGGATAAAAPCGASAHGCAG